MIQRIQTIYLLIAGFLTGSLFFVPFAEMAVKAGSIYRYDISGIYLEGIPNPVVTISSLSLVILVIAQLFLTLVTIFLFKKRKLQIKLSVVNMVVLLAIFSLILYSAWWGGKSLSAGYSLSYSVLFPLFAIIVVYMAIRAIKKDELLVRSIDRVR